MADQIALRTSETQVSAGSAVSVTAAFRDRATAAASTPSSIRYRVDCLTNGANIVNWTSVSAASSTTIDVAGGHNAIIDETNEYETRQLLVEIDTGLTTQSRQAITWRVKNIRTFVPTASFQDDLLLEPYHPITDAEDSAGVTPTNYQYPVGHMFRYGVPTDGTSNCTPALNKAIAVAAQVTSGVRFYFPAIGTVYRFTTQPDDIEGAFQAYGDGRQTVLYRDFNGSSNEGGLFNFRAAADFSVVRDMSILSVSGRTGGCLISFVADSTNNVSMGCLSNLRLTTTGTDTHAYAIYIDGVLNTDDPKGVRSMFIENCDVFGGTSGAIYMRSVVAARITGTCTYQAGGTSGQIVVTGDGTTQSSYVTIDGATIAGIDLSECENVACLVGFLNGSFVRAATALRSGLAFTQGVESIFERTGGNQVTARYNASNGRAGLMTAANSGQTFLGGNLTHSGTGNVYNHDITGLSWWVGDPFANGELEIGSLSGTAGNAANLGTTGRALRLTALGNICPGRTSATNMTDGFIYVPARAGPPSGTPTAITGFAPMYFDTTNNDFYIYDGGWIKVTLA